MNKTPAELVTEKTSDLLSAAMDESQARVMLDQLKVLQDTVTKATALATEILENAIARQSSSDDMPERPIAYFTKQGSMSRDVQDHAKNLRRGKYRRINRLVNVDPVYIVCVGNPGDPWEDRYRLVESEDSAKAVLILHNL